VCTGGKTKKQVLADADKHKLSPVVFIQDKDFDDLIGTLPTDPRIVTLNRYSFENYLLDPDALVELAIESKRRLRREGAIQQLALEQYLPDLYKGYRDLASLFVIARRMNLKGIKTTKQPVSDLLGPTEVLVSEADVAKFQAEVTKVALASQSIATVEELSPLVNAALVPKPQYLGHADDHPNSHLCGKHLLELALRYIDGKVGTALSTVDRFEIAMRLIMHLSLAVFARVKATVSDALSKQNAPPEVLALVA
jgi:hypothetical protein